MTFPNEEVTFKHGQSGLFYYDITLMGHLHSCTILEQIMMAVL